MNRMVRRLGMVVMSVAVVASLVVAQPGPRRGNGGGPPGGIGPPRQPPRSVAQMVEDSLKRMMMFDADRDGQLSRSEVADERLKPLFDRADANEDNVLTKGELTAVFTKDAQEIAANRPMGPSGPGGPGRGPGGGPPGPGAPKR